MEDEEPTSTNAASSFTAMSLGHVVLQDAWHVLEVEHSVAKCESRFAGASSVLRFELHSTLGQQLPHAWSPEHGILRKTGQGRSSIASGAE